MPQRSTFIVRNVEQIADDFDGDGDAVIIDEIDDGLALHRIEQVRRQDGSRSGSMSAITRGVSAPLMSRRTRVCSGGSLKIRLVV